MAVLDHHRVVEHCHIRHAAIAVAGIEIGTEYRVLLGGRYRHPHFSDDIAVTLDDAAHAARRPKVFHQHPN